MRDDANIVDYGPTGWLSGAAMSLWAKTDPSGDARWLPLYQHMADAGEVARLLFRDWVSKAVREQVKDHAGDEATAEALVVWLAATHDLGKAAPGFQFKNCRVSPQVQALADRVHEAGLPIPRSGIVEDPPNHALMSQVLLCDWLERRHEWDGLTARTYAIVPGGHHGVPPSHGQMECFLSVARKSDKLGREAWLEVQDELADYAADLAGVSAHLRALGQQPLPPTLQMVLTGLVIMADWIASNDQLCPLFPTSSPLSARERARQAWQALDLPGAWHPGRTIPEANAMFRTRFPEMPPTATLRPVQQMVVETASRLAQPGLIILEAPMGSGKTEAALLAAETIATRFGQGGVAFLLPTMATSNAMFTRVHAWLNALPDSRGPYRQSLRLAHGKSALNREYAELTPWTSSSIGEVGVSGSVLETAIAHGWLIGRKRALLSSFVVGTVDQLLMAGLKVRHVVLRHLGLAGKVVIIDEVHAYDAYMSVYLDRVLSWLGAYHVPVILLSATLPPGRRQAMVGAYAGARRKAPTVSPAPRTSTGAPAYPLVTASDGADTWHETCQGDARGLAITLEELPDDDETLIDRIRSATAGGGCVGIIRNTVTRAQATYQLLKERLDAEVILDHSRFIACDRMAKDADLLRRLGKDADERPQNLIVVGTQVLEQSLDIDFDLLISDIAPVDLLLQRIGRLHRHSKWDEVRPVSLRDPRCLLTAAGDWQGSPPTLDPGTAHVYQTALVWRTVAALRNLTGRNGDAWILELPNDIAPLVETVYEDQVITPPDWDDALSAAAESMRQAREGKESNAKHFLLGAPPPANETVTGLLDAELTGIDDHNHRGQVAVRDTEDSIEVVVVQGTSDARVRLLPWVGARRPWRRNQELSEPGSRVAAMEEDEPVQDLATELEPDRDTARVAATCTVALPPAMNRQADSVIRALEERGAFPGWQQSPWLRGQLPLVLDDRFTAIVEASGKQFHLQYDPDLGLRLLSKEEIHD